MNLEFIGKGINLSDDLKSYTEHQVEKFERHIR